MCKCTGSGEEDYCFKLCDVSQNHIEMTTKLTNTMSSANRHETVKKSRRGTISFESPEVFKSGKITFKSDVYAFAMVMHELLYPENSFPWASVYSGGKVDTISFLIIESVNRGERPKLLDSDYESSYCKLMRKAWSQDPNYRPNASYLKEKIEDIYLVIFYSCAYQ